MRNPDLPEEQAQCVMWLEIFDKSLRDSVPVWDINPAPEIVLDMINTGNGAESDSLGNEGYTFYGY
jgi:hypothetical protein